MSKVARHEAIVVAVIRQRVAPQYAQQLWRKLRFTQGAPVMATAVYRR